MWYVDVVLALSSMYFFLCLLTYELGHFCPSIPLSNFGILIQKCIVVILNILAIIFYGWSSKTLSHYIQPNICVFLMSPNFAVVILKWNVIENPGPGCSKRR